MSLPKPIATVDLLVSALGLLKSGAIVFVMMLLEWSRKREAQAKLETKAAKTDLAVEKKSNELENEARGKSSADVVADFLAGPK